MKGYISGFAAVLLAVIALSFTTTPKVTISKITGKAVADVCTEAQKRYYVINLPCNQQDLPNGQLDVNILLTQSNWSLFGTGTVPPTTAQCLGSVCACVIKACPDPIDSSKPDLSGATDINAQLTSYASTGTPVTGVIFEKN